MKLACLDPILPTVVHTLVGVEEGDVTARGGTILSTRLMDMEECLQQLVTARQLTLTFLLFTDTTTFSLWWAGEQQVGNLSG